VHVLNCLHSDLIVFRLLSTYTIVPDALADRSFDFIIAQRAYFYHLRDFINDAPDQEDRRGRGGRGYSANDIDGGGP
jgi:hypothetical protein